MKEYWDLFSIFKFTSHLDSYPRKFIQFCPTLVCTLTSVCCIFLKHLMVSIMYCKSDTQLIKCHQNHQIYGCLGLYTLQILDKSLVTKSFHKVKVAGDKFDQIGFKMDDQYAISKLHDKDQFFLCLTLIISVISAKIFSSSLVNTVC